MLPWHAPLGDLIPVPSEVREPEVPSGIHSAVSLLPQEFLEFHGLSKFVEWVDFVEWLEVNLFVADSSLYFRRQAAPPGTLNSACSTSIKRQRSSIMQAQVPRQRQTHGKPLLLPFVLRSLLLTQTMPALVSRTLPNRPVQSCLGNANVCKQIADRHYELSCLCCAVKKSSRIGSEPYQVRVLEL